MATSIYIKTEIWNSAIRWLKNERWNLVYKYDLFDAGIDYDLLVFEKEGEYILFGWDNWVEGEIQAQEIRMKEIEQTLNINFQRGEPLNLKESVVSIFWTKNPD